MKKLFKTTLAIMLIACFMVMSTGCFRINQDWTDVEGKLVDERYDVYVETDVGEIEYYLYDFNLDASAKEVECILEAEKGNTRFILIFFCYDKGVAEDIATELEELVTELARELEIKRDDIKVGRHGKVAFIGHKDAVKDAK